MPGSNDNARCRASLCASVSDWRWLVSDASLNALPTTSGFKLSLSGLMRYCQILGFIVVVVSCLYRPNGPSLCPSDRFSLYWHALACLFDSSESGTCKRKEPAIRYPNNVRTYWTRWTNWFFSSVELKAPASPRCSFWEGGDGFIYCRKWNTGKEVVSKVDNKL